MPADVAMGAVLVVAIALGTHAWWRVACVLITFLLFALALDLVCWQMSRPALVARGLLALGAGAFLVQRVAAVASWDVRTAGVLGVIGLQFLMAVACAMGIVAVRRTRRARHRDDLR